MASIGTALMLIAMAGATMPTAPWQVGTLNRAAGCVVGSLSCAEDCASVLLCTADGYVLKESCQANSTICDATILTCEPIATAQCVLPWVGEFTCHFEGAFPNPYDCHRHHYCGALPNGTLLNFAYQCEDATAYDPLTTMCLLSNNHRVCREGPIPPCLSAGQAGPQQENPNIYYICVRDSTSNVVPWLFRCARDAEVFDGVNCVPRVSTTTAPTTTTPWTTNVYNNGVDNDDTENDATENVDVVVDNDNDD